MAKKAKAKKKEVVKPKKVMHLGVSLTTGGKEYITQTNDIAEFVLGLGLTTTNTKTLIKVTYKKKTAEKVYKVAEARRIFINDIATETMARNFKLILGCPKILK